MSDKKPVNDVMVSGLSKLPPISGPDAQSDPVMKCAASLKSQAADVERLLKIKQGIQRELPEVMIMIMSPEDSLGAVLIDGLLGNVGSLPQLQKQTEENRVYVRCLIERSFVQKMVDACIPDASDLLRSVKGTAVLIADYGAVLVADARDATESLRGGGVS